MKDKRLFLQWALFVALIVIGAVIGTRLGWAKYVFSGDSTHLTLVPLALFVFTTGWCGRLSWKLSNGGDLAEIRHTLESTWFSSSVCVNVGLLGTAIGYYLMMKGEGSAEQVVLQVKHGMNTAFMNTIVGGFCGQLIEAQSHFLGQAVKESARARREVRRAERIGRGTVKKGAKP